MSELVMQGGRVRFTQPVARVQRARTSRTIFVTLFGGGSNDAAHEVLRALYGREPHAFRELSGPISVTLVDPPKGVTVAHVSIALAAAGYAIAPAKDEAFDEWRAGLSLAVGFVAGICARVDAAIPEVP